MPSEVELAKGNRQRTPIMKEREPIATANPAEIETLIERVGGGEMRAGDAQRIETATEAGAMLRFLESKNTSLARLKRLLFGPKSERRAKADAQERQADPHAVMNDKSAQNEGANGEPRSESGPSERHSSVERETSAEILRYRLKANGSKTRGQRYGPRLLSTSSSLKRRDVR